MYDNLLEASGIHFPPYLTPGDRHQLYEELKQFPKSFDYYWPTTDNVILQGDGLPGFLYIYSASAGIEQKSVTGIVISNSCDIVPADDLAEDQNVLFAPIAPIDRYVERYRAMGKTQEQVESFTDTIRKQMVTTLFYLPSYRDRLPESIVPLDDIRPEPVRYLYKNKGDRIFSLSQYGFWIFLIKLSIHFTRMQEGVRRFST